MILLQPDRDRLGALLVCAARGYQAGRARERTRSDARRVPEETGQGTRPNPSSLSMRPST